MTIVGQNTGFLCASRQPSPCCHSHMSRIRLRMSSLRHRPIDGMLFISGRHCDELRPRSSRSPGDPQSMPNQLSAWPSLEIQDAETELVPLVGDGISLYPKSPENPSGQNLDKTRYFLGQSPSQRMVHNPTIVSDFGIVGCLGLIPLVLAVLCTRCPAGISAYVG
jgi:hypothetical protein